MPGACCLVVLHARCMSVTSFHLPLLARAHSSLSPILPSTSRDSLYAAIVGLRYAQVLLVPTLVGLRSYMLAHHTRSLAECVNAWHPPPRDPPRRSEARRGRGGGGRGGREVVSVKALRRTHTTHPHSSMHRGTALTRPPLSSRGELWDGEVLWRR